MIKFMVYFTHKNFDIRNSYATLNYNWYLSRDILFKFNENLV